MCQDKSRKVVLCALLAILLVTVTQTSPLQAKLREAPELFVRLQSRQFVPKPGLDRNLSNYFTKHKELDAVHVFIQFGKFPSLDFRRGMERKYGVTFLSVVPEVALLMAMPPRIALAKDLLSEPTVRWIGPPVPTDKVAPRLLKNGVPAHARLPQGLSNLIVLFHGDVNVRLQEVVLSRYNAKTISRIKQFNGWRLALREESIRPLASEDQIMWIEEVPPPAGILNDTVRSETGTKADAVLTPAPYGLSGRGVVIGLWEQAHPDLTHRDYVDRLVLGDQLIMTEYKYFHTERPPANGLYDSSEAIYSRADILNGHLAVQPGDQRLTLVDIGTVSYGAQSVVQIGDADVGTSLVTFQASGDCSNSEMYASALGRYWSARYIAGGGIYLDRNCNAVVDAGDTVILAPRTSEQGLPLHRFYSSSDIYGLLHVTHISGILAGSGQMSANNGGTENQWMGVAPGATVRAHSINNDEGWSSTLFEAVSLGSGVSSHSWGYDSDRDHYPETSYRFDSQIIDSFASGRDLNWQNWAAERMFFAGAAGNDADVYRHTENISENGRFDPGEAIYLSRVEYRLENVDHLVSGSPQPVGTRLVDFTFDERHTGGRNFGPGDRIYHDVDLNGYVNVGDVRFSPYGQYAVGSVVGNNEEDVGHVVHPFKPWGSVVTPWSSKNALQVANINSETKAISLDSGRGPTPDGRVKPDVAAPGHSLAGGIMSTAPGDGYARMSGTSMSTPAAAGAAALLTEWYRVACRNTTPVSHTLRALLIHGAEDLTDTGSGRGYIGPDYTYGYGRIRLNESADLLPHHIRGLASQSGNSLYARDYHVTIGSMDTLRATLVWDDPPFPFLGGTSGLHGLLVNDLDLLVIAPDGTRYTPWILDGKNSFAKAENHAVPTGQDIEDYRDHRNTVEQVQVTNPMPGRWTLRVSANRMWSETQDYTLVSEMLSPGQSPCATEQSDMVWIKDNPSGDDAEPASGGLWTSPDLWNRTHSDGGTEHQNPEYSSNSSNYLYANVRNRSRSPVPITSIDVWLAPASLGLIWPDNFHYVGRFSVPNLGPSENRTVGPLRWYPPQPPPGADHFCFYIRVESPQDPVSFEELPSVGANARDSNNLATRNVRILDLSSSRNVVFLLRNTEEREADVKLVVDIAPEFLGIGEAYIRFSREMEEMLPKDAQRIVGLSRTKGFLDSSGELRKKLGERRRNIILSPEYRITDKSIVVDGIRMKSRQSGSVTMRFYSGQKSKATYDVQVQEEIGGKMVGGILLVIRTGHGKGRTQE